MRRILVAAFSLFFPMIIATTVARADGPTPAALAESGAVPEHHGSAYVDPVGFLMFGPRVGADAGGAQLTGGVYGRWFDPGLLGRSLFLKDGDRFAFSYGVGARGRYYFGAGH